MGMRAIAASAGRYLSSTVLTSGTSFTTGGSTNKIFVRLQAGGGGGGGVGTAVTAGGGGGGGAAGGYAEKTFTVTPNTAYTYAIGAAGAAGAAGANNGGAGGDTTFAVGATTVTTKGGNGGIGGTAATTLTLLGGAAPAISTNGDVNASGQPGAPGEAIIAATVSSGSGGSCVLGAGGNARNTQGAGGVGVGYGAGGSGGCLVSGGADVAGGAGLAGMIVVDEYA